MFCWYIRKCVCVLPDWFRLDVDVVDSSAGRLIKIKSDQIISEKLLPCSLECCEETEQLQSSRISSNIFHWLGKFFTCWGTFFTDGLSLSWAERQSVSAFTSVYSSWINWLLLYSPCMSSVNLCPLTLPLSAFSAVLFSSVSDFLPGFCSVFCRPHFFNWPFLEDAVYWTCWPSLH